jgi:hypothetical protein
MYYNSQWHNQFDKISSDTLISNGSPIYFLIESKDAFQNGSYILDVDVRKEVITVPTLSTTAINTITSTTCASGGNIYYDGGAVITVRGVCWNTTGNPTINDNKTIDGVGIGSFTSNLSGLSPNITYYVKAYATNNVGTAYGDEVSFMTNYSDIIDAEYFFNSDPGFGKAHKLPINIGKDITINTIISLNDITVGLNRIYVRVKNSIGFWSIPQSQLIIVQAFNPKATQITASEYFFDSDPGVGNGISLPVQSKDSISISTIQNIQNVSTGLHRIYFRVKDNLGNWSIPQSQLIIVQAFNPKATQITAMEYFFDSDPGVGKGISLPVQSSDSISISTVQNIQNVSTGLHRVYFRVKDNLGNWSVPQSQLVIIQNSSGNSKIDYAEYFFDTDPGMGNATKLNIISTNDLFINETLNIETLTQGIHTINVRVRDESGKWSIPVSAQFEVTRDISTNMGDNVNNNGFLIYGGKDKFSVLTPGKSQDVKYDIRVYTLNGSLILNKNTKGCFYSSLNKGIYLIEIVEKVTGKITNQKILIY